MRRLGPLFPVPGLVAQASLPAGVPSATNATSSATVLAANTASSSTQASKRNRRKPKVPAVTAASTSVIPQTQSEIFSNLKKYVLNHDGDYFARTDDSTDKRKMIPLDQYKALPDDTRAALLKLKTFSRSNKPAQVDASQKAVDPTRPTRPKKSQEQTALLTTSVAAPSQSVAQFSQFGPVAGQYVVNDPRQGFVPFYDHRQQVLAAQYTPPAYQYGVQSFSAPSDMPRAQATVLAVGHQALPGYGDPYRAPSYPGSQPQLFYPAEQLPPYISGGAGYQERGGGGSYQVRHGGGGSSSVSQSGGGGGYQGAPTFFPASAPQSPLALQQQQPRSVKWLGNSAAADSRAGDPGDHR